MAYFTPTPFSLLLDANTSNPVYLPYQAFEFFLSFPPPLEKANLSGCILEISARCAMGRA